MVLMSLLEESEKGRSGTGMGRCECGASGFECVGEDEKEPGGTVTESLTGSTGSKAEPGSQRHPYHNIPFREDSGSPSPTPAACAK